MPLVILLVGLTLKYMWWRLPPIPTRKFRDYINWYIKERPLLNTALVFFLTFQTDVQVSILRSDSLKCHARILLVFNLYPEQVSSIRNYVFGVGVFWLVFFFLYPFSVGHAKPFGIWTLILVLLCLLPNADYTVYVPFSSRRVPKWKPGLISVCMQYHNICCFASLHWGFKFCPYEKLHCFN